MTQSIADVQEVEKEKVDWLSESAGSIYDRFTKKGAKLGTQANKMIRMLKESKFLPSNTLNILGKNKEQRSQQRALFVLMPAAGVELLRHEMQQFMNPPFEEDEESKCMDEYDIPKSLRARAWHLADDPRSVSYLEIIFGGINKKARRAHLDDKTQRNKNYWQELADDFFNNPEWQPQNPFSDTRVVDIKPQNPPTDPYSAETLRALFSKMRTQYSVFNDRYHRSGQLEAGNGDGDDEFFDKFCGRDVAYFYAHLLFQGLPPKFCTRDICSNQKSDVGINTPKVAISSNSSEEGSSSKKRKVIDLEDMWNRDSEIERDKSMTSYFKVQTMTSLLKPENFDHLPPDMQFKVRAKYAEMVANEIEF